MEMIVIDQFYIDFGNQWKFASPREEWRHQRRMSVNILSIDRKNETEKSRDEGVLFLLRVLGRLICQRCYISLFVEKGPINRRLAVGKTKFRVRKQSTYWTISSAIEGRGGKHSRQSFASSAYSVITKFTGKNNLLSFIRLFHRDMHLQSNWQLYVLFISARSRKKKSVN